MNQNEILELTNEILEMTIKSINLSQNLIFLKASDDSMSPYVCEGDDVQLNTVIPIESGKLVAAEVNGKIVIRRIYEKSEGYFLVSKNKGYPPIECTERQILGVAVRVHIDADKLLERDYS